MSKENAIVQGILTYINSIPQSVAEKVQGTALSSGKADINACVQGHAVRIEVKTADHGNKESKKQLINLMRWSSAGAICIIAYTVKDVQSVIGPTGIIKSSYEQSYGSGMTARRV